MSGFLTEEEFHKRFAEGVRRIRTEYGDTQLGLDKGIKNNSNLTNQIEGLRMYPSLYTAYRIITYYGLDLKDFIK